MFHKVEEGLGIGDSTGEGVGKSSGEDGSEGKKEEISESKEVDVKVEDQPTEEETSTVSVCGECVGRCGLKCMLQYWWWCVGICELWWNRGCHVVLYRDTVQLHCHVVCPYDLPVGYFITCHEDVYDTEQFPLVSRVGMPTHQLE